MSIEDIDYLKENSTQDNFILHIDSALRDRAVFPKPSKYVINFDQPFRHVFGIDVLDASIPSTMFNVDVNNNTLRAGIYKINSVFPPLTFNNVIPVNDFLEDNRVSPTFVEINEIRESVLKTIDIQTILVELYGIQGFNDVMADTNYIAGLSPFTYKILVTSYSALTWAYHHDSRSVKPRDSSEVAALDYDDNPDFAFDTPFFNYDAAHATYLQPRHIKRLAYSPPALNQGFLVAVRRLLVRPYDRVIMEKPEVDVLVNGASARQTFFFKRDFTYAPSVDTTCKFTLYANCDETSRQYVRQMLEDAPTYLQTFEKETGESEADAFRRWLQLRGKPYFDPEVSYTDPQRIEKLKLLQEYREGYNLRNAGAEDIAQMTNGLKTPKQLYDTYVSLSGGKTDGRFMYIFEFMHQGTTYYIQWGLADRDQQTEIAPMTRLLVRVIEEFSKRARDPMVHKLDQGPVHSFSLQKVAPHSYRVVWYYWVPTSYASGTKVYVPETATMSLTSGPSGESNTVATTEAVVPSFAYASFDSLFGATLYYMYMGLQYYIYNIGNYGVSNFLAETRHAFVSGQAFESNQSLTEQIQIDNTTGEDITLRPKLRFSLAEFGFFFDMEISTIRTVMGFDEYATDDNGGAYRRIVVPNNNRIFTSNAFDVNGNLITDPSRMFTDATSHKLVAPGVLYLLGTRYCILRCEELDDHVYGSRSYGPWSPGMAVLKMFNVNDVAHQRIDFVNFSRKPFHPIGKLDKLSLRFETSDGQLYDFKGINHLLVLSVKYYVPSQKRGFEGSVLNPNYQKDFASYFLGRSIAYKEPESGDDDDVETFPGRHVKKQIRYGADASSDGGTDYTESSSEFDFQH